MMDTVRDLTEVERLRLELVLQRQQTAQAMLRASQAEQAAFRAGLGLDDGQDVFVDPANGIYRIVKNGQKAEGSDANAE